MDEELYCLNLDDYSAPSFTSFGKAYYGTLPEIRAFINALAGDERLMDRYEKLIAAFREYEAGNLDVKHNVAYQEIPLLEAVFPLMWSLRERLAAVPAQTPILRKLLFGQ